MAVMHRSRSLWSLTGGVVVIATLVGCSQTSTPSQSAPTAPAAIQSDRLFFGRNIPSGGTVSDAEWATFLAEVATPRLPHFAVMRSEGQWRLADGEVEHEASFVLQIDHPAGEPSDSTFEAIAQEYRRRFRQEAVIRISHPAQQWLYGPVVR